jgi:hypothetical protein
MGDLIVIDETTLRHWQRVGPPPIFDRELIHSHLQAYEEVRRLRSALEAVLGTLDAVDSGEFDSAIEGLLKLDRLN